MIDARTGRRLGIHASALLVVYGERRSTLFHGGAHDVVSSRTPYLHATQWGAHDVWSHPVRRAVFPRPHDPRDPMRVSMMSGLVPCVAVSPPAVPTPTSGAHTRSASFHSEGSGTWIIGHTGDGHRLIFRCWWRRSTNVGGRSTK